jgi:hypothetical protein
MIQILSVPLTLASDRELSERYAEISRGKRTDPIVRKIVVGMQRFGYTAPEPFLDVIFYRELKRCHLFL